MTGDRFMQIRRPRDGRYYRIDTRKGVVTSSRSTPFDLPFIPRTDRRRRKPFTAIGIARVPCSRCGEPSSQQWNVCADGNQFRGVCDRCDVLLNAVVLKFMRIPDAREKMRTYQRRMST